MKYDISAKTTVFDGQNYRSRLEAKWAAMFQFFGWEAEYEPSEINGYNPDFIIKCSSKAYDCKNIIVEVKPSVLIDDKMIEDTYNKYKDVKAHILILSDFPFTDSTENYSYVTIGIGSQYLVDHHSCMHELYMKSIDDFGSYMISYDAMIFGKVERKQFLQTDYTLDFEEISVVKSMWKTACNRVMFQVKNKK